MTEYLAGAAEESGKVEGEQLSGMRDTIGVQVLTGEIIMEAVGGSDTFRLPTNAVGELHPLLPTTNDIAARESVEEVHKRHTEHVVSTEHQSTSFRLVAGTCHHAFGGDVEQPSRFPAAGSLGNGIATAALGQPLLGKENQRRIGSHKCLAVEVPGATIRAVGIGELAQELELAGKAGDSEKVGAHIDELLERCRKLGDQLKPLTGGEEEEEDDSDKPLISDDELYEAYALIKEASEEFQFENIDEIVMSLKDYRIPDAEKDRVNNIIKAVGEYEYDKLPEILS